MARSITGWPLVAAALLTACAGGLDPVNEDQGQGAEGGASTGGASSGGAATGGDPGGGGSASGGRSTGGAGATPGTGGTDPIDCSTVGCAPPPLCATGCTASCGCCPCADGETMDLATVKHECIGGCWAPVDAACDFGGQSYAAGATFSANDTCNTCECQPDGSVVCTEMACPSCDPALEQNRREYAATSPSQCMLIDYGCPENTTPFTNDCGCGCEQSTSCPEWIDCMPGGANAACADLEAYALTCPYTGVAY